VQGETETPSTTPLEPRTMPDQMTQAFEHILGQLDVLTQTVSILEERLTIVENRLDQPTRPQPKQVAFRESLPPQLVQ
jgi:centriolar protein POC1